MLDAALALALTVAATGCDPGSRAPAAGSGSAADGAVATPPAPPAPPAYRPRPGPAYVAVERAGVFRLEDGVFTRVLAHTHRVHRLAVAPDGALLVTAIGGAWRLDGDVVEHLVPPSSLSMEQLAVGPDGVVWTSDRRAVWRWDGAWAEEPAATFDGDLIYDLAVDPRGQVWVLLHDQLWRLAGDRWHQVDLSFTGTDQPFLAGVAIAPDGAVHVTAQPGAFAFRAGAWQTLPVPDRQGGPEELAIGPAGHLATSSGLSLLTLMSPDGRVRNLDLADGPARARHLEVLAVDGAGRAWVGSQDGLIIVDDRGRTLQQWLPGSLPEVVGRVTAVTVVGDGPTLPTPGPPRVGSVTGVVHAGGRPAAGALVELCDLPMIVFTTSPCERSAHVYRATADRAGRFEVTGVPHAVYQLAVRADRWVIVDDLACCTALATAPTADLGRITLR